MSKYKEIENYYNQTQILYDLVYSKGTHSLHYGYWYENTKNTKESILNNNKFIMESLDANSNDKILDAGCGIGGISLYLAKHTNAKIEGITLSEVQLKKARKLADKFKFSKNINFSQIIKEFNLKANNVVDYINLDNKEDIKNLIYNSRKNKIDIIEYNDNYTLYNISELNSKLPDNKDEKFRKQITNLLFEKEKYE